MRCGSGRILHEDEEVGRERASAMTWSARLSAIEKIGGGPSIARTFSSFWFGHNFPMPPVFAVRHQVFNKVKSAFRVFGLPVSHP